MLKTVEAMKSPKLIGSKKAGYLAVLTTVAVVVNPKPYDSGPGVGRPLNTHPAKIDIRYGIKTSIVY